MDLTPPLTLSQGWAHYKAFRPFIYSYQKQKQEPDHTTVNLREWWLGLTGILFNPLQNGRISQPSGRVMQVLCGSQVGYVVQHHSDQLVPLREFLFSFASHIFSLWWSMSRMVHSRKIITATDKLQGSTFWRWQGTCNYMKDLLKKHAISTASDAGSEVQVKVLGSNKRIS